LDDTLIRVACPGETWPCCNQCTNFHLDVAKHFCDRTSQGGLVLLVFICVVCGFGACCDIFVCVIRVCVAWCGIVVCDICTFTCVQLVCDGLSWQLEQLVWLKVWTVQAISSRLKKRAMLCCCIIGTTESSELNACKTQKSGDASPHKWCAPCVSIVTNCRSGYA
jgi:hypothetical protein